MGNTVNPAEAAENIQKLLYENGLVYGLIGFVISAVGCFFGYKLTKVYVAICGFLLGFTAGVFIGTVAEIPLLTLPLGFILAIVSAIISLKVYKMGVFLSAFLIVGLSVAGLYMALIDQNLEVALIIGATAGIIAGIIAVIITKPLLIIMTSISYGSLCGSFLTLVIESVVQKNTRLELVLGIVFIVLGLIVQIKTNDGLLEHPEDKAPSKNYAQPQYVNPYAVPGQQNPQYGPIGQKQPNDQYNDFLGNRR